MINCCQRRSEIDIFLEKIGTIRTVSKTEGLFTFVHVTDKPWYALLKKLIHKIEHKHDTPTVPLNIPDFSTFSIPIIKQQFPGLFADKIVGVQPMTTPSKEQ